jgi:hypothetical protein
MLGFARSVQGRDAAEVGGTVLGLGKIFITLQADSDADFGLGQLVPGFR